MGCGIMTIAGFSCPYPGDAENKLRPLIKEGKKYNRLIEMTIPDRSLEGENGHEVLAVLKKEGLVQAARWENGAHPGASGGVMLNLFIWVPKLDFTGNNSNARPFNWLDKRRKDV